MRASVDDVEHLSKVVYLPSALVHSLNLSPLADMSLFSAL